MGISIAKELARNGSEVNLILGPSSYKINFPKANLLYWVDKKGTHSSRSWSHQAKDILQWMYK